MSIAHFRDVAGCVAEYYAELGVTTSVNEVTAWADQSGSGNNATQPDSSTDRYPRYPAGVPIPALAYDTNSANSPRMSVTIPSAAAVTNQSTTGMIVFDNSGYCGDGNSGQALLDFGNGVLLYADYGSQGQLALYGVNSVSDLGVRVPSGRCVIVVTMGNTSPGINVYINGVLVSGGGTAQATIPITSVVIGDWPPGGAYNFRGNIYATAIWNVALSSANVALISALAMSKYNITAPSLISGVLVFGGDSLTRGTGSTDNQTWPRQANFPSVLQQYAYPMPGQTTEYQNGQAASLFDPLVPASGTGPGGQTTAAIFVCWMGTNNMDGGGDSPAAAYASYKTLLQGRKTAGFYNCICFTVNPRNSSNGSFESQRQTFNASMRADFNGVTSNPYVFTPTAGRGVTYADYLVDVAALPQFGPGMHLNTDNFASDGIHLTNMGYAAVAKIVNAAVAMIFPTAYTPPAVAFNYRIPLNIGTGNAPPANATSLVFITPIQGTNFSTAAAFIGTAITPGLIVTGRVNNSGNVEAPDAAGTVTFECTLAPGYGAGQYQFTLTNNAGLALGSVGGATSFTVSVFFGPYEYGPGPGFTATTVTVQRANGSVIPYFSCWLTSDSAGLIPITAVYTTNSSGQVVFQLVTGTTYYISGSGSGYQVVAQAFTA